MREQHRWQFANVELVGRSRALREILQAVEELARTESATGLMLGESGAGKDLVGPGIPPGGDRT